jgi:hypothetical protein
MRNNNVGVNPYVSVDCVLFGFDGEQLNVLLVKQCKCGGLESTDLYKLPGSLIGIDEELDDAAYRVLKQFTGLVKVDMMQFRTFGSVDRLSNSLDKIWLTRFYNLDNDFERIITIGYLSLIRIDRQFEKLNSDYLACWMPLSVLPKLAFDHNEIVSEALKFVRKLVLVNPVKYFELLPRKFTIAQFHSVYMALSGKYIDIRNFHKKIQMLKYVVPLDVKEVGVSHRAARYYKFDRKRV